MCGVILWSGQQTVMFMQQYFHHDCKNHQKFLILQNLRLGDHTPMLPMGWYCYHCLAVGEIRQGLLRIRSCQCLQHRQPSTLAFVFFRSWRMPTWLPVSLRVCTKEVLFIKDINLLHASFILGFLVNYQRVNYFENLCQLSSFKLLFRMQLEHVNPKKFSRSKKDLGKSIPCIFLMCTLYQPKGKPQQTFLQHNCISFKIH